jgi:hypothetical protein
MLLAGQRENRFSLVRPLSLISPASKKKKNEGTKRSRLHTLPFAFYLSFSLFLPLSLSISLSLFSLTISLSLSLPLNRDQAAEAKVALPCSKPFKLK